MDPHPAHPLGLSLPSTLPLPLGPEAGCGSIPWLVLLVVVGALLAVGILTTELSSFLPSLGDVGWRPQTSLQARLSVPAPRGGLMGWRDFLPQLLRTYLLSPPCVCAHHSLCLGAVTWLLTTLALSRPSGLSSKSHP